jgi:hypothetical protein
VALVVLRIRRGYKLRSEAHGTRNHPLQDSSPYPSHLATETGYGLNIGLWSMRSLPDSKIEGGGKQGLGPIARSGG